MADFSPQDLFAGINFDDIFGGLNFNFGGGLFDTFFRRRASGPQRGENIEVELEVPLERVLRGGEEKLRYTRPATCPTCHGSGAKPGTAPRKCDTCGGTGRQVKSQRQKGVALQQITTCPACGGSGTFLEQRCPECKGSGQIVREETLTVKIPAGIEEGTALRVAGHGLPSDRAGGMPGDLFVVVRSVPHPHFERAGPDLWRTEVVEVADTVLGATLRVPTLDGEPVSVTLAPGTQPDTVLRLHDKGLPEFGGKRRGDLLVRITVHIPERPSADERRLYQQLRALGHARKG